jgi:caffeoyl-CoA O-methyltransferase
VPHSKNPPLTPELYDYLIRHNPQLDVDQRCLVDRTRARYPDDVGNLMAEEQGPLLAFLTRLTGARKVVEVGTFTGFSALSLAQALPPGGRLITCDISEEWTALAQECWRQAAVADRIDLRLGLALDTLRALPDDEPWIDLSLIDADKINYPAYWDELVRRTRPNGLIVVDNTLFHGDVADSLAAGGGASIRAFNDIVLGDRRVEAVLLSIADGVTLARRVSQGPSQAL